MPAKLILLSGASPQDEGEALVVNYLREHLPSTYTIIPNAEIAEPGRPPFEYDLIVVAPHAVYVVETKRWRGGIGGDDNTWLVDGRHRRQNPLPTANNKARVLKSQIQRRRPDCDPLWIEAVVTIADDEGQLNLRGSCRERVFRYTDLPAFLTDPAVLNDRATDLRAKRDAIEQAIQVAARGRPLVSSVSVNMRCWKRSRAVIESQSIWRGIFCCAAASQYGYAYFPTIPTWRLQS
jgi:hypothetical protein